MIIFSQGPTLHSRLANSLVWMSKIHDFLVFSKHECCFPWAIENYIDYFEGDSFWMIKNEAYQMYYLRTKKELNSKNISSLSREIEHDYEVDNSLNPYKWESIINYSEKYNLLYMSGNFDITSAENIELIKKHECIIIHEPYNIKYKDSVYSKNNYKHLTPKAELLNCQRLIINALSQTKKKIGLHIRRGDYSIWESGKYYYDDDFWLRKVAEFVDLNCQVFIFTNEDNLHFNSKLRELGAHVSNESFEIDFVRMMLMDEIYGPPSTFSLTAINIAKTIYELNPILSFYESK
jgi:hypothetical protein